MGPEQAVRAHVAARGGLLVPVHWGTFNLAFHGWTEPVERLLVAAEAAGVAVAVPRPGASVEPAAPPPVERWWPDVAWQTAAGGRPSCRLAPTPPERADTLAKAPDSPAKHPDRASKPPDRAPKPADRVPKHPECSPKDRDGLPKGPEGGGPGAPPVTHRRHSPRRDCAERRPARPVLTRTDPDAGMDDRIIIRGAREHNLKSVDLDIPRGELVVITGLSGSGKSSLAFDTIYAEGQRRYMESLSAYARQFLGVMERPDVDLIDGLSPVIAIEQKTVGRNPRSTVGTVTEIYDFLRLLYARASDAYSYVSGAPMRRQSDDEIIDALAAFPEGTRVVVLAPVVRGRKGHYRDLFEQIARQGFERVRDRRRDARDRARDAARPLQDARRRGRRGPARRARGHPLAHRRRRRDRARHGRRDAHRARRRPSAHGETARGHAGRRDGRPAVLAPPDVARGRRELRGPLAQHVLVQQPLRRVPGLQRARRAQGDRPRVWSSRTRRSPSPRARSRPSARRATCGSSPSSAPSRPATASTSRRPSRRSPTSSGA